MKLFSNTIEAEFIERPNRFLVKVNHKGKEILAHCANPGRMTELLFPGIKCILEKNNGTSRKTKYTLAAVYRNNEIIPLISNRANNIAKELIIPQLFPNALEIKSEVSYGNSRFDFLVTFSDHRLYIEVKSCTLIENNIGMFPDAPSLRASKHLNELYNLNEQNTKGAAIIVLHNKNAKSFLPNFHTDTLFTKTLLKVKNKVDIFTVAIDCNDQGEVSIVKPNIKIEFDKLENFPEDQGAYILVFEIKEDRNISIGAIGNLFFKKGFYIYVGSAMKSLKSRVARHKRKKKNLHWHIDYLLTHTDSIKDFVIKSNKKLECSIAKDIKDFSIKNIENFGSSDCKCKSHLFYFTKNPLHNKTLIEKLFWYRHTKWY